MHTQTVACVCACPPTPNAPCRAHARKPPTPHAACMPATSQRPALYTPPPSPPRRWEQCRCPTWSWDFGVCSEQQRAETLSIAEKLNGGAPMRLSPCDLYPYLRGRTLWLIGCAAEQRRRRQRILHRLASGQPPARGLHASRLGGGRRRARARRLALAPMHPYYRRRTHATPARPPPPRARPRPPLANHPRPAATRTPSSCSRRCSAS